MEINLYKLGRLNFECILCFENTVEGGIVDWWIGSLEATATGISEQETYIR